MRDGPWLAQQIFARMTCLWPEAPDWLLGEAAAIEVITRIQKNKVSARWHHDLPPLQIMVLALLAGQSALAITGFAANSAALLVCVALQDFTMAPLALEALAGIDDLPLSAHQRLSLRAALKRRAEK